MRVRDEDRRDLREPRRWWLLFPLPGLIACALPTPIGQLSHEDTESTTTGPPPTTSGSSSSGGVSVTTATTDVETGMIGPFEMHAWVMRYDDFIDLAPGGGSGDGGTSGGGTGSDPSPDTLVVQISTGPDDCDDPWAGLQCGNQWSMSLLIPPPLQVPGTYQIFDELGGFVQVTGPDEGGDICSGGAGSLDGQADLSVVSEQEVSGQLSMTDVFDFDANVAFTAVGCG